MYYVHLYIFEFFFKRLNIRNIDTTDKSLIFISPLIIPVASLLHKQNHIFKNPESNIAHLG